MGRKGAETPTDLEIMEMNWHTIWKSQKTCLETIRENTILIIVLEQKEYYQFSILLLRIIFCKGLTSNKKESSDVGSFPHNT